MPDRLSEYLEAKEQLMRLSAKKKLTAVIFAAARVPLEEATPAVFDCFNVGFNVAAADLGAWLGLADPTTTDPPALASAKLALQLEDIPEKRFLAIPSAALRVLLLTIAACPIKPNPYDEEHNTTTLLRTARVMESLDNPVHMQYRCGRIMTALSALAGAAQHFGNRMARLTKDVVGTTMSLLLQGRRGGLSGAALDFLYKKGVTLNAKQTNDVFADSSKLVSPTGIWPNADDGSRPLVIRTGDNVDIKPDEHFVLTNVITLGMTLTRDEATSLRDGFATMPRVSPVADVGSLEMTDADQAALRQWTTVPHCLLALWAAVRMRQAGYDAEAGGRDCDPETAAALPQEHPVGTTVEFDAKHRVMSGIVRAYATPHYTIDVLSDDGRERAQFGVHSTCVRRTSSGAAVRAAAPAVAHAFIDSNPDGLDPIAFQHRSVPFQPSEWVATGLTQAHSKHKEATASMHAADAAKTADLDKGGAWCCDFEFFIPLCAMFWTRGKCVLPVPAWGHLAKSVVGSTIHFHELEFFGPLANAAGIQSGSPQYNKLLLKLRNIRNSCKFFCAAHFALLVAVASKYLAANGSAKLPCLGGRSVEDVLLNPPTDASASGVRSEIIINEHMRGVGVVWRDGEEGGIVNEFETWVSQQQGQVPTTPAAPAAPAAPTVPAAAQGRPRRSQPRVNSTTQ